MRAGFERVRTRDASAQTALDLLHRWRVFVHAGSPSMRGAHEPLHAVHLSVQNCVVLVHE